jgi:topoisomerase IA-like protein
MPRGRRTAPVEPEELEDDVEELEDVDEEIEELDVDEEPEELEDEPAPKRGRKAAPAKAAAAKKAPAKKAPATKKAPPAREEIEFDSNWLAEYVNEAVGTDYDGRAVRMLLRKLAKDEVITREIGVDRSRYSFTGPADPSVKAVLRLARAGGVEDEKAAALEKARAAKAAKAKAAPAKATKAPARKAAAPAKATRARRARPADDDEE